MSKKLTIRTAIILLLFLFAAAAANAQPETWKRMELTGTGISIESPQPFTLVQDKPDAFLENQVAQAFWKLSYGGVFATVIYEKVNRDPKTPRQSMDETAKLFAGQDKSTFSKVTDTTWQDEPAAMFEETFFDTYAKKNTGRRMTAFGKGGELTTINVTWHTDDPASKAMADRIYYSARKTGEVAPEISKMPPTKWERLQFKGLVFETPSREVDPDCKNKLLPDSRYAAAALCYMWGGLRFSIVHRKYAAAGTAPSADELVKNALDTRAAIDRESSLKTTTERKISDLDINSATGKRVTISTGYGTVASVENEIYITLRDEVWIARVFYTVRWKFDEDAAERIISSLAMVVQFAPVPTPPAPPKTAKNFYDRASIYFDTGNMNLAEADLNEAIKLDPKMADAYIMRAKIYCSQKLIISAMHDENRAIALGGKIENPCGRKKP